MPNDAASTLPVPIQPAADRGLSGIQPFQPATFQEVVDLAKVLSQANIIPSALRGKPNDVAAIVLHGASLGIDAMSAIRSMHIIEGKPTLSADLMVGLAKRSPVCEYFILVESTDEVATWETKRRGDPKPVRLSFTIAQARAAGLTGKSTWKAYPAAMLRARGASGLGRAVYSDLFAGVYDPDELETVDITPRANVGFPSGTTAVADEPAAPAFDLTSRLDRLAKATTGDEIRAIDAEVKPAWDGLSVEEKDLYTAERKAAIEAGKARAAAAKAAEQPTPASTEPAAAPAEPAPVEPKPVVPTPPAPPKARAARPPF